MRFTYPIIAVAVLISTIGCGGIAEISGKVTYEGKPLTMGRVFINASNGKPYFGKIEKDGTYVIREVPPGRADVAVSSPNPDMESKAPPPKGGVPAPRSRPQRKEREVSKTHPDWFPIPDKYADILKSPLSLEVKEGANTFNIELE